MSATAGARFLDGPLTGSSGVPGDKSISHRSALLAAMASGRSRIRRFSTAGDCASTLHLLRQLGVVVHRHGGDLYVDGRGVEALPEPPRPLDCGRSGTTMRLAAGLLAGTPGRRTVLSGDDQLLRRPMTRVAEPLRRMGASVGTTPRGTAPLTVDGAALRGIQYVLPVASAQVKSAILLAGLQASGTTVVVETVPTRDHTERLLRSVGVPVAVSSSADGRVRTCLSAATPDRLDLVVPGDFSSAAPLIAAAALVPGSDVLLEDIGLNPTRTGLLRVLDRMGAAIEVVPGATEPEPRGSIRVRHTALQATSVTAEEVPALIDELPLVGLLAAAAEGRTEVRGAAELRAKESDRITGLVAGLRALGASADELSDGFEVQGPAALTGGYADALGDHRLAMTFVVAGLIASGAVHVSGQEFVSDSFPEFFATLGRLRGHR
ncbi:MAG: 3-phosphoshikimate 1-carboxyvinyltransferase [Mycobacteriales bacterium]